MDGKATELLKVWGREKQVANWDEVVSGRDGAGTARCAPREGDIGDQRELKVWCRFEGVRVENSGGGIADVVEKNRRIRNHMHSKQQKRRKMTIASIYMYMMVDIDARTGVWKIEIQGP